MHTGPCKGMKLPVHVRVVKPRLSTTMSSTIPSHHDFITFKFVANKHSMSIDLLLYVLIGDLSESRSHYFIVILPISSHVQILTHSLGVIF